jgi:hypothetical protein
MVIQESAVVAVHWQPAAAETLMPPDSAPGPWFLDVGEML